MGAVSPVMLVALAGVVAGIRSERWDATGADGVQQGERVLTSANDDCRRLDAAIAFVIALAIDV